MKPSDSDPHPLHHPPQPLVLAEVARFLARERDVLHGFLQELERQAFTFAPVDGDLLRPGGRRQAGSRCSASRGVVELPPG